MGERLTKRVHQSISSQLQMSPPKAFKQLRAESSDDVSSREYNELLNLLMVKNRIIDEIKFECNNGKEQIPTIRIRKILAAH